MKSKRFVALLVAAAAAGCSRSATGPDDTLNGTWNWVRSTGGIAGQTYTPASVGYSVQFRFDKGKLTVLRNDSVKATPTYSIDIEGRVTYEPPVDVFTFAHIEEQTVRALKGDTISLADPCCDRYDYVFVRAR